MILRYSQKGKSVILLEDANIGDLGRALINGAKALSNYVLTSSDSDLEYDLKSLITLINLANEIYSAGVILPELFKSRINQYVLEDVDKEITKNNDKGT